MKLNEVNQDNLHDYIYKTKWTSEWGMIDSEIQPLIKHLQGKYVWNEDKYNSAMTGNTCMLMEGEIVNYHCDVLLAVNCALENRTPTVDELD